MQSDQQIHTHHILSAAKVLVIISNVMLDSFPSSPSVLDKKLPINKISSRISKAILDLLQEIFQSHSFLMSQNFETLGCQWVSSQNELNLFLRIRVTMKQGLGQLFITSCSFYFFAEIDSEQISKVSHTILYC